MNRAGNRPDISLAVTRLVPVLQLRALRVQAGAGYRAGHSGGVNGRASVTIADSFGLGRVQRCPPLYSAVIQNLDGQKGKCDGCRDRGVAARAA